MVTVERLQRPGGSRPAVPGRARRTGLRRTARAVAAAGTGPVARVREASRAGLTTRAAALGLVICALVVSAALPLREYLAQRGRITQAEQDLNSQRTRVADLERERHRLADPAYVASLARERLHYVLPGETAYVVLGPDPTPAPAATSTAPATSADSPWYTQLYGSLQEADRPAAAGP